MRVLEPNGILIFKWNETRVPVSRILEIINERPLLSDFLINLIKDSIKGNLEKLKDEFQNL